MTDAVRKITDPIDANLAKITQALGRLEAKRAVEQQDLLRAVAEAAAVDPAFKYALAMLIFD
jgi:hypothetical protein